MTDGGADAEPSLPTVATPVRTADRITSLDAVRGVATLGILVMNAVAFGLVDAAYFNLDAGGTDNAVDRIIGIVSLVLVDQKMMALFSLLFGVGVVIFAERAAAKGRRVGWLSLWRFVLLLGIGFAHSLLWDGDVLILYAICAPIVLLLRNRRPVTLLILGSLLALAGPALAPLAQGVGGPDGQGLGDLWLARGGDPSDALFAHFLVDAFGRALGLMLIGVALYRWGGVQGHLTVDAYRRMIRWGFGLGVPFALVGVVIRGVADWSPDVAIIGQIPNGLATIPMAMGYLGSIVLWNQSGSRHRERVTNVGRMALTNYLTQSVLGVLVLTEAFSGVALGRTAILGFIVAVWAVQLWWSTWWLERFRFGPVEWAWRCATYRRWQPIRRAVTPG